MQYLSNELLLKSYQKAYELNLGDDFLDLFKAEIERRHLVQIVEH